MDSARDMATFQVLARTGTISAAAHEIGVAPSAVSRRLKALEARLGIELVRRSTRAMVLTPAGEAYLERSKELLSSIDALEEEMREEALGVAGAIRLAAPLSFGVCALPPVVSPFLNEHPDVSLELDLRDDQVDLIREGFDLALRIGELAPSTLIAKKLNDIPTGVYASPAFVAKHGPFEKPLDLEGVPGMIYANVQRADVLNFTNSDGSEGKVMLDRAVTSNNGDILAELAAKSHGVYCCPTFITRSLVASGDLVEILGDTRWPAVALYAVWPPTKHLPARVRTFIDAIAGAFKSSSKG